jgi:hypothetical protein
MIFFNFEPISRDLNQDLILKKRDPPIISRHAAATQNRSHRIGDVMYWVRPRPFGDLLEPGLAYEESPASPSFRPSARWRSSQGDRQCWGWHGPPDLPLVVTRRHATATGRTRRMRQSQFWGNRTRAFTELRRQQ